MNDDQTAKTKRSPLRSALWFSIVLGIAIYAAFACYSGAAEVGSELAAFNWWCALYGCALAAGNYAFRFVRWELYLRQLSIRIPLGESAKIFFSGFSLTVTPGKMGELLKSVVLRERYGIPIASTAPIILAERLTDLMAAVLLALSGAAALGLARNLLLAASLLCLGLLALLSSRKLTLFLISLVARAPIVGRFTPKVVEFYGSAAELLKPAPLFWAMLWSSAAWWLECVSFFVVVRGFPGAFASLNLCTFIYVTTTIAGALTFLPGGLGVQEGGMVELLVSQGHNLSRSIAFAATFVTRLCTLWFAVLVGLVALALVQKRGTRIDLTLTNDLTRMKDPSPKPSAVPGA